MKIADVVVQLIARLPQLTSEFTDDVPVSSMSRAGTVMTVNCDDEHGLRPGEPFHVVGAVVPISITSLTRSGTTGTLVTTTPHDLTTKIATQVTISGAAEAEFNGTFTVISIVDRTTVTFTMANSGPTTATGSPVLENAESFLRQYDGIYAVEEVTSPVSFTFQHSVSSLPDPLGTMTIRTKPRISGGVNATRVSQAYTKQAQNKLWAFVVLDDVVASKDRDVRSDAIANQGRGIEFRQQVLQPFTVLVFVPTADDASGLSARDLCETLFRPICRSLLFSRFDSGLDVGKQGTVQFSSHGVFSYDVATYVHAYSFQQVVDLTFADTVGPDDDVAFRDVDFTITVVDSIDLAKQLFTKVTTVKGTPQLD